MNLKSTIYGIAAAAMLTTAIPASAANVDEQKGSGAGYSWKYWNDVEDDGAYWPNWWIDFSPELQEVTKTSLKYTVKKGNDVVMTQDAIQSGIDTKHVTFYSGPINNFEPGNYTLTSSLAVFNGDNELLKGEFTAKFTVAEKAEEPYEFVWNHTETVKGTTVIIDYEFVNKTDNTVPADAKYFIKLGQLVADPHDITGPDNSPKGQFIFENFPENTNVHFWTNNPYVEIDGKKYYAEASEFDVTTGTLADMGPIAKLTYTATDAIDGAEAYLDYSIQTANIDNIKSYKVWLTDGDKTIAESDKAEGKLTFKLDQPELTALLKGQVVYTDENGKEQTIATTPSDVEIKFIQKESDPFQFTFEQTTTVDGNSFIVDYKFVNHGRVQEVPDNAVYFVQLGIEGGNTLSGKAIDLFGAKDKAEGQLVFYGLKDNQLCTIWSNNPRVTIDGVTYNTNCPNWTATTTTAADATPKALLTYTTTDATADTDAKLDYNIELINVEGVTAYNVKLVDKDGKVIAQNNGKDATGSFDVKMNTASLTATLVGEITYTKDGATATMVTTPNNIEVTFSKSYNIEFYQECTSTMTSITVNYEFRDKNGLELPEDAVYHLQLGVVGPGIPNTDIVKTEAKGSVVIDKLTPGSEYMFYSNNPYAEINGKRYYTEYPNWTVKTLDPQKEYDIVLNIENSSTDDSVTIKYKFESLNGLPLPEGAYYYFKPGIVGQDDKTIDPKEGEGEVTYDGLAADTEYTIYANNPYVIINYYKYEFEMENWTIKTKEGPKATLTYEAQDATPDSDAKITYKVAFESEFDYEPVAYKVWIDVEGADEALAENTEAEGTFDVKVDETLTVYLKGEVTYKNSKGEEVTIATTPTDVAIVLNKSNGISYIDAADEDAMFFTLQGVKVSNPEKGLYIMVKEGKTSKVMVK